MKIAFDVQGTLTGHFSDNVLALFSALKEQGHEIYIWSFGGRALAREVADDLNLKPDACISKREKQYDDDTNQPLEPEFDFCIDDDRSTAEILDAKRVIYVNQIPDHTDNEKFSKFLKYFNFTKENAV